MISNPTQILQSYHKYSEENEEVVLEDLKKLTSIDFAFKMNDKKYFLLVNYFIGITEERFRDKIKSCPKYFEKPEIVLLMQSYIAKLRLQNGLTLGQELQTLKRLPDSIANILLKISPGTILKSYYQLLYFSPKHNIALKILNQHPTFFVNMIIMKKHLNMVLLRSVTNPIGLKLLAKKYSTQIFLNEFNTSDSSIIPPIVTTTSGDKFYARISDAKLRLFTIVAEPLIRSASLNNELDYLCQNAPKELLSHFQTTVVSLASMNPLPQCLIPYISAISTRFSSSILGRIRDPESFIKAIKLYEMESPHLFDTIATIVTKSSYIWPYLSKYINDLPELNVAIRSHIPYMLQIDQKSCIEFLSKIKLTDKVAVSTINLLKPLIPESYNSIMNLSKCGELSFRVAAGAASAEESLWIQFCQFYYNREEYTNPFLDFISDFINSGNFFKGLELLDHLSFYYSSGNQQINSSISEFIYQKYANFQLNTFSEQLLFAKVFGRVHKFSSSILPILQEMPELSSKCLLLLIRYLWHAVKDDNPSFLIFRLRLLAKRYGTKKEPRPWTYEILYMPDH